MKKCYKVLQLTSISSNDINADSKNVEVPDKNGGCKSILNHRLLRKTYKIKKSDKFKLSTIAFV